MKNYLVSIIMPCHNGERYLAQSIGSVLNQTYKNWELLVIDDASTDSSINIIKEICIKDSRVKLLINDNPTGRPASPRNFGITHAKGDFIAFLDCDDLWKDTHLENLLSLFGDGNDVVAACSWYSRIDDNGIVYGLVRTPNTFSYHHLFYDNFIGNLTGMYDVRKRGKVYQRNCGHEDYIMWIDVLKEGGIAKSSNSVEAYYRVSNQSVSSNKAKAMSWRWHILRHEMGLPALKSLYYVTASVFFIWLKKSRLSFMLPWIIKTR